MFQHLIKTSLRNLMRHRSSFLINLVGLSTGLACVILIYLWVNDELAFDKFHQNDSRLFQIMKNSVNPNGKTMTFEWTPGPLAKALKEDFPEVIHSVAVEFNGSGQQGIMNFEGKKVKAVEQYAGAEFFNVFSFPLIEGNPQQVLQEADKIVISDEVARKLFNSTNNAIGKAIEWEQSTMSGIYQISGVFQKPPPNSSMQFDIILSYEKYLKENPDVNSWTYGGPSTYVVLENKVSAQDFSAKISNYLQEKSQEDYQSLFARPYSSQYLNGVYKDGQQAGGRIAYVRLFSIIALFVLLIACINFMNLATARASIRIKEVGVKKAIGAGRRLLIYQYLGESIIITFSGLMIALGLVSFLLPYFNELTGKALSLTWDGQLALSLLAIGLATGLLAGSYPAFYLSAFKPANVLRGKLNRMLGALWARKGLVVFQFTISLILIVAVMVSYQQVQYIQSKNLGFNKDQIISVKREGRLNTNLAPFMTEVKNIPGVRNASSMRYDMVKNHSSTIGIRWDGADPEDRVEFAYIFANYDLIETLGMEMAEGRSFSKNNGTDSMAIIFNEAAIEAMGIEDPVGKTVVQWRQEKTIIGVVKDFHFQSLYEEVRPCFLFFDPEIESNNILVKIEAGKEQEALAQLEKVYIKHTAGLPFEYHFMDEDYQILYESETKVAVLSRYFAGLAILLSCLGLFGLVTFTADRRKKEISIRKVLGASVLSIVRLLSKNFMQLVGLAILIALPIGWFIATQWLQNFAYHIELSVWMLSLAGIVAILIAFLTVSIQGFRAANLNPADNLYRE